MKIILDTNILVRFFSNDIPQKADQVEKLLKEEIDLDIPDVVFPELEYVLTKGYKSNRLDIVEAYEFLLSQHNLNISSQVKKAVNIYKNSKLDMADCIIAAYSFKGKLASFDNELLSIEGISSHWPNS